MKNIPQKIYLQTALEEYGETCEDFNELSDLSWCSDKVFNDDLEFISVDFILAEIDKLKDYANSSDEYEKVEFAINILKKLLCD